MQVNNCSISCSPAIVGVAYYATQQLIIEKIIMKTNEIRQAFLDYFQSKGHQIVPSSSLVPEGDQTLLFTNAGMVQFKDVFLGRESRPYSRAVSSQCCLRVSGKHNDFEQVGFTARHHTFFEMLGNFSFGDYFKKEAIHFAWEFLTKHLGLPKEKLWITVFEYDDEAADIWIKEIGIDPNRFSRCSEKDNFWAMGDTGPCGPCSEIFYDHGPEIAGGPPGSPDASGDRYTEIWNLVFMQYNRDASGDLVPLPKPSVDTGMGLERIAAVMQGVHSNFDIDIFQHLIKEAAKITKTKDLSDPALKVIADHLRAMGFLIADGIFPSNEGRGYVLRRIIRRAIRYGHKLGHEESFLYQLVKPLIKVMGEAYPKLEKSRVIIEQTLKNEEQQFKKTLQHGLKVLENAIDSLDGKVIPGDVVFKLYDTYGFPIDLTAVIAKERGLTVDEQGFEKAMQVQRNKAKAASQFSCDYDKTLRVDIKSDFLGYDSTASKAKIKAILKENEIVDALSKGEKGQVILDKTPFYAESGGQVGDAGVIRTSQAVFAVSDTQKSGDAIIHMGEVLEGVISKDDKIEAIVAEDRRQSISHNHTATHLLHSALRQVLGDHVQQKGSLVEESRLRFDFTHRKPVTSEELQAIEKIVNERIRHNVVVNTSIMSPDEAIKKGAMALFGEKYGDKVRVLQIGDHSLELCGGTHATRTGDIGLFKILSEGGIAAGIRRIEAVTGNFALEMISLKEQVLHQISQLLKTEESQLLNRLIQLMQSQKQADKKLSQLSEHLARDQGNTLMNQVKIIDGIKVLATKVDSSDVKSMRDILDQLKNKLNQAVILLAAITDQQSVSLIAGVTKDCDDRFHAGELIRHVSSLLGGKGGGRQDMAQGGGNKPELLEKALNEVEFWVKKQIK